LEVALGGPLREDDLAHASARAGDASTARDLGEDSHAALATILDRLEDDVAGRENVQPKAFLRRCAQLWMQHHGRRFNVYATTRCEGAGRAKKKGDKELKKAQRVAMETLFESADGAGPETATILNMTRERLLRKAKAKPAGKRMQRFHALTVEKKARNQIRRVPGAPPPKRRQGNVFLQRPVPAFDYDSDGPRKICLFAASGTMPQSTTLVRVCAWGSYRADKLSCIVMDNKDDLASKTSWAAFQTGECAHMLLAAVTYGWTVVERNSLGAFLRGEPCPLMYHSPATNVGCHLQVTDAFDAKHRKLSRFLRVCAESPGSKWTVHEGPASSGSADPRRCIDSVADVFDFARSIRRVRRSGVSGSLFDT
jgi:hypothetical protein